MSRQLQQLTEIATEMRRGGAWGCNGVEEEVAGLRRRNVQQRGILDTQKEACHISRSPCAMGDVPCTSERGVFFAEPLFFPSSRLPHAQDYGKPLGHDCEGMLGRERASSCGQ